MKLIDRDALLSYKFKNPISYQAFANLVKRVNTIDLVTCGKCVWHGDNDTCIHRDALIIARDDDFCSKGERREDEHTT